MPPNRQPQLDAFASWVAGLANAERIARCRALRALALVFCGPGHPLVHALLAAERDGAAAAAAHQELDKLPALQRRRVLANYAALVTPGRPRRRGRQSKGESP